MKRRRPRRLSILFGKEIFLRRRLYNFFSPHPSGRRRAISGKMDEDSELFDPEPLSAIDPTGGLDDLLIFGSTETRRRILKQVGGTGAAITLGPGSMGLGAVQAAETGPTMAAVPPTKVTLKTNGQEQAL